MQHFSGLKSESKFERLVFGFHGSSAWSYKAKIVQNRLFDMDNAEIFRDGNGKQGIREILLWI